MTVDERVICNGLDMHDKHGWDGTYPYYEPTKAGFKVHLSKKSCMPGIYTDRERAIKGYNQYRGKIAQIGPTGKAKKKG